MAICGTLELDFPPIKLQSIETNPMNFNEMEFAGYASWPSSEQQVENGLVLRSANGFTKRANSANIVGSLGHDYLNIIQKCEHYFEQRNLRCIFRLLSYCDNQVLDTHLSSVGYKLVDPSIVLYQSLQGLSFDSTALVLKTADEWIESYCRIADLDLQLMGPHLEILKRVQEKVVFAVLEEGGTEVSCAMGVISNGYFGLFDLVTRKAERARGHGKTLMEGLLSWAASNGSKYSYLQVVADNDVAMRLYKKMGYQYAYDYWYRIGSAETP